MDLLLEHGQTRPDILEQSLEKQKLLDRRPSVKLTKIISEGITDLQARMRTTSSEGHFEIESAQFRFNSDILSGLEGSNWISHELILLCMHLADRLPHIRIGFSVPIHENIRGRERKVLRDPFERAADQIEKWNKAESEDRLVCFFPLFQNDNHFSLLEINQRDGRIYHYDSKGYKTSDIQVSFLAFRNRFGVNYLIGGMQKEISQPTVHESGLYDELFQRGILITIAENPLST